MGLRWEPTFLGMARGPNRPPLCTNIEVLFLGMDFLRTTAYLHCSGEARRVRSTETSQSVAVG